MPLLAFIPVHQTSGLSAELIYPLQHCCRVREKLNFHLIAGEIESLFVKAKTENIMNMA